MKQLSAGVYRHYKGRDYQVFNVAHHSETEEALVVYRCLYGDYSWWVRPLTMFTESVEVEGKTQERFAYCGDFQPESYPEAPPADLNR